MFACLMQDFHPYESHRQLVASDSIRLWHSNKRRKSGNCEDYSAVPFSHLTAQIPVLPTMLLFKSGRENLLEPIPL